MPTITAVRTVKGIPAVSVLPSFPPDYSTIKQSLGTYTYKLYQLYLSCANLVQLNSLYTFVKYDSNGNRVNHMITPAIAPYQRQDTLFYDMRQDTHIIDGRNSINFSLLPLQSIQFLMYLIQDSVGNQVNADGTPALSANNFKFVETATGMFNFFDDFTTQI